MTDRNSNSSRSKLALSFDQDKTVNSRYACASKFDTSVTVEVRRTVTPSKRAGLSMSSMEAAPPHLLMKNVRDIRQRLLETEKTLNKITKAEAKIDMDDDLDDLISVTSSDSRRRAPLSDRDMDNIDDDRESIQSGLATLPDSSYAGFERVQPPSSTPCRPSAKSRVTGVLEMVESRDYSDIMLSRDKERKHSDVEEDKQDYRAQIRFLKEANKKVLIQNQKLMNEVEKTSYELQSTRAKVRELSNELDEYRQSVPDLEDKILGLQAETESQDKALREAEERYEVCQRQVLQTDKQSKDSQHEIDDIKSELHEERKLRRSLEGQRDEALQNFLEAQDTLEEYQKKMKDRMKKSEQTEDHLRDSLSHANREREELIERLSWFQSKVKSQQEDIRRLQSLQEVEEDTKTDIEEQNNELRTQISKLSSKISRLEGDSQLLEGLQFENRQLKSQVESQHQQLSVCQQEIEESRTMLVQLEQLALHSSRASSRNNSFTNDSGNFSIRQGGDVTSGASFQKSSRVTDGSYAHARPTSPSQGSSSAKNILSDLRLKLAMKDSEIQQLNARLQSHDSNNQSDVIDNLRTDLTAMIERNQRSAEQAQEMNSMVTKITAEKEKVIAQFKDLKRELADRDTQNSSFDMRINQRNTQIVELQEQLNDKTMEMAKLERQVRQKSSQVTSLEEQLIEKTSQCAHQAARASTVEGEMSARESEAQALHAELRDKQEAIEHVRAETERVQQIHEEQCRDYQKQVEIIQERVENKSSQANEWEKQTDILRRDVSDKAHRLHETEQLLARTQEELKKKTGQGEEMLCELEKQARDGTRQIQQLEGALKLCKEEIHTYISVLEETKELYDKELASKEEKIKRLSRQHKITSHDLEVQTVERDDLERQVIETQTMLQQSTARIQDLEDIQTQLQRQVSSLEHDLLTGNSQWMSDQQTMETKLKQACEELEERSSQCKQLSGALKSLQAEKKRLCGEIDILENQLTDEQEGSDDRADRVVRLERDLRDMRVQLEHKIELVTDFEDQLLQKNRDMEQQLQLVSDLDIEIKRLQDSHQEALDKISSLERNLDKAGYETKAKDEMLEDMKDTLARTQEELSHRKGESSTLQEQLDKRQEELEDRVALVAQLDGTIKEQHSEMEMRIHKLDANLHKQETEVQERTKQISDLDDKLQQTTHELREKTLQHQQMEQLSHKQQMELQSKSAKLQEQDTLVERQKRKLDEQKDENVEITQELRLTREQLQQQHADFMSTRRELAQTNRDQERIQRDMEELKVVIESHEKDNMRLAEELGAARARESEAKSRVSVEVNKLSEAQDDMEHKYHSELGALREEIGDYREANDILKAQLKDKNKQQGEMEQHYADQVQVAAQALDGINDEMEARKLQMDATNEQVILKDSEIARLQAKISGLERTLTAMRLSDSFNMTSTGVKDVSMDNQGTTEHAGHSGVIRSARHHSDDQGPIKTQDLILTDVSVTFPNNNQITSQNIEFGQEVEIHYVTKGDNNRNNIQDAGQADVNIDQENIEPSGPVRVLNFADCDLDKKSYNSSVIHRPKPVLPNSAYTNTPETLNQGASKESNARTKQQKPNSSAFSRVLKEKKPQPHSEEKVFPGEKELEPVTAMRMYNPDNFDTSDLDPEQCMRELHERLRANELRQQDIDRQLMNLEDDEPTKSDR